MHRVCRRTAVLFGEQVSEISGGITNILWKLSPGETRAAESVVLRVFGKQTDKIIDREKEKIVLKHLNKAGFGAQACLGLPAVLAMLSELIPRTWMQQSCFYAAGARDLREWADRSFYANAAIKARGDGHKINGDSHCPPPQADARRRHGHAPEASPVLDHQELVCSLRLARSVHACPRPGLPHSKWRACSVQLS